MLQHIWTNIDLSLGCIVGTVNCILWAVYCDWHRVHGLLNILFEILQIVPAKSWSRLLFKHYLNYSLNSLSFNKIFISLHSFKPRILHYYQLVLKVHFFLPHLLLIFLFFLFFLFFFFFFFFLFIFFLLLTCFLLLYFFLWLFFLVLLVVMRGRRGRGRSRSFTWFFNTIFIFLFKNNPSVQFLTLWLVYRIWEVFRICNYIIFKVFVIFSCL